MMKTKLCMFDLDGTLLDTIDDIANSMNHVLDANHYPLHDIAWYKEKIGYGARNLLLSALPPEHGQENIGALLDSFKEYYQLHSMELTKPYDGIPGLLRRLSALSIQMAVVTNKPQKSTDAVLQKYFQDTNFVAVYGEKSGRPIKPDPFAAREILSSTGTLPEQAVFIGDAEVDMLFAQRASVFSIGVLWGFRDRDTLERHGAKAIVESPERILEYINI